MFKTRLLSGILLADRSTSDDHQWRICIVFYVALYFTDRYAGTL